MNSASPESVGVKQKLVHELKRLLLISVYLAVFFSVFKLYKRLLLDEYQLGIVTYGYVILQSLALAKIILTAEVLHLGERFHERPLIVPTLYHAVVFSAFTWAFDVVEHFIVGTVRGKGPSEVLAEILDKGWAHMLAMTLVVFVAFLPFFAFRELDRGLGEGKLRDLFLGRRETVKLGEVQDATH
jgi:hypothetical protein